ncbi:hypothetical protein ACTRTA_01750 [Streptococcus pneumoniae]|nr:hypothetical protein [Streptococcus pneumoniae]MDG7765336.1 hypothetical protein [Streptococcus pneumoniae]MDG8079407.1 hypothetical protein [Streptococcus pneumoniae]MDG8385656.1 hypothetical protein [Streptococcus pneumoniae]MDG8568041.1 hypothetical protein [Streptococcus pneumoniae]
MNTYKILKDNIETIYLGKADGSLLEIERKYFDFLPEVGEEVEVFGTDGNYIITRRLIINSDTPDNTKMLKIWGWICTATSLLFFPFIFGVIGIVLGYLIRSRGDKEQGTVIMICATGAMIFGMWLGAIVWG